MNNSESKRFSIALSFPGEYRTFVEKVADNLTAKHVTYFRCNTGSLMIVEEGAERGNQYKS